MMVCGYDTMARMCRVLADEESDERGWDNLITFAIFIL